VRHSYTSSEENVREAGRRLGTDLGGGMKKDLDPDGRLDQAMRDQTKERLGQ